MKQFYLYNFYTEPWYTASGIRLILEYLQYKYSAHIDFVIDYYSFEYDERKPLFLRVLPVYLSSFASFDVEKIAKLFSFTKNQTSGNYRKAFLCPSDGHIIFMAYIREGKKERILYSDSVGSTRYAKALYEKTGIPVFVNQGIRQSTKVDCFIDAIIFGRDIIGINPKTGKYLIPGLIYLLEKRVETAYTGYSIIKLPNELLKTAQISDFVTYHQDLLKANKKIHKNKETLAQLRARHSKEATIKDEQRSINNYLHQKTEKYNRIMEIQFYLNEIEYELGNSLSQKEKSKFIIQAKERIATENQPLYQFAQDYLEITRAYKINLKFQQDLSPIKPIPISNQELADKYHLLMPKLENCILQLQQKISELDLIQIKAYEVDTKQKAVLTFILENEPLSLALLEFISRNKPDFFSTAFWHQIARVSLKHADLILNNKYIINQMYQRNELYFFADCGNPYLAKNLMSKYPSLLNELEQIAFMWNHKLPCPPKTPKISDSLDAFFTMSTSKKGNTLEHNDKQSSLNIRDAQLFTEPYGPGV